MMSCEWLTGDSINADKRAYQRRCIEYIETLPAAMPWCEYLCVLKALSQSYQQPIFSGEDFLNSELQVPAFHCQKL